MSEAGHSEPGIHDQVVFKRESSPDYRVRADQALREDYAKLKLELAQLELERQKAAHDDLTGLRRRDRFEEDATRYMRRNIREGNPMAVLYVDANHLKAVNDGSIDHHSEGDILLRSIAGQINTNLRTTDVTGRMGGDEFAAAIALLPQSTPEFAELLRLDLKQRINHGVEEETGHADAVSVGLVLWDSSQDLGVALKAADQRMYDDKFA